MSNNLTFDGTVVRDAEVRHLQSGQSVLSVTVANNQGFGERKTVMFIRVSLWGKRAEGNFVTFLTKGATVFVSGELSQREYESNGQTKTSLELNATILDLIGGKRESNAAPQQQQRQTASQKPAAQDDYDDSDIPF
jgi:single-strand DNA-binding protein